MRPVGYVCLLLGMLAMPSFGRGWTASLTSTRLRGSQRCGFQTATIHTPWMMTVFISVIS